MYVKKFFSYRAIMFFVRFNCFPKQSWVFIFKFYVCLWNLFFMYSFFALQHLLYIVCAACRTLSVWVVLCLFMFLLALRNVFLYVLHSSSCHGISVFLPCHVNIFCLLHVLYLIIVQWNFKLYLGRGQLHSN